jgi:hypothetical protein
MQASCVFLGGYSTLLCLVFHKGNATPSWDESDFPEAIESAEYTGQSLDIVVFGEILYEKDLVRREELVENTVCCCCTGGLEA